MQDCAQELPRNVSEVDRFDIELVDSELIATPRVAASHVQFECTLYRPLGRIAGRRYCTLGRIIDA